MKDRLLIAVLGLRSETKERDVYLVFEDDVGETIFQARKANEDSDAVHLMRAAQIIGRDIFDRNFEFNGTFPEECEKEAVPACLMQLVNMIIDGPNIKQ